MRNGSGGPPPPAAPVFWPVVLSFTAVKLAIHLYASGSYGYFRDELYFIACGRHLDWGYVDHSPLIGVYARIGELLGPSLRGFRLLATLAGAARVLLAGVLAAQLGGGRRAQALTCLAVLLTPVYLAVDSILSMNVFEHVIWLGALLVVVKIANGGSETLWLAFGVIAGIGLQNKHSMLFFGFALFVGIALTPLRRSLLRPWIWMGGAVAALIFLPNVLWQMQHGWPTLELLRNVKETGKNVVLPPHEWIVQQVMMLHPVFAPLWIAGLIWLFRSRYRFLAWTYLTLLVTFIVLEGKDYYLAPIYPALYAGGAIWLSGRRVVFAVALAVFTLGALIAVPLALPILPPERYLAYQRALGVEPQRAEVSHTSEMPQIFSDQFGWEEMVQTVARYYNSLPPGERRKTAIFCVNYGQAGAIDFYGPRYGLPPAVSGHQNYFLWGPRDYTGESVIVIDSDRGDLDRNFATVAEVAHRHHPYAMPEENGPVFHCRGLKVPLREIWPSIKNYR